MPSLHSTPPKSSAGFFPSGREPRKPQIFVSYAHVDDEVLPGARAGWVRALIDNIKALLPQTLGRPDDFAIWVDRHALTPNDPLTDQIVDAVRQSDLLLVVLSVGYTRSAWCGRERSEFLRVVRERGRSKIFVVEKQPVEQTQRPDEFRDLLRICFWAKKGEGSGALPLGFPMPDPSNPAHSNYYARVDDLCNWLAKAMEAPAETRVHLPQAFPVPASCTNGDEAPVPVFLAPVGYDLEAQWDGVRRYLDQVGVTVLPETAHPYFMNPESFSKAAGQDLANCGLFVQLLSEISFREPPESPTNFTQLQMALAQASGKPILQWRHPRTRVSAVADASQRDLLDAETVRAESIEDFKQEVRRRAFEKPAAPKTEAVTAYVLVDATAKDAPLTATIAAALEKYGANFVVLEAPDPDSEQAQADPQTVRRDLEDNFKQCDALIVVYGASPSSWVVAQHKQWRKSQASRSGPLNMLALVDGPPEQKMRVSLPGVRVVDCRKGCDEASLKKFLDEVRTGVAP